MSTVVALIPKEGHEYKVMITREGARLSNLIQRVLSEEEDEDFNEDITVPEIEFKTLTKVVEFAEYHKDDPMKPIVTPVRTKNIEQLVCKWDANFISSVKHPNSIIELAKAAAYLDMDSLLDLVLASLACYLGDTTPHALLTTLGVQQPSIEEMKQVAKEEAWLFEWSKS